MSGRHRPATVRPTSHRPTRHRSTDHSVVRPASAVPAEGVDGSLYLIAAVVGALIGAGIFLTTGGPTDVAADAAAAVGRPTASVGASFAAAKPGPTPSRATIPAPSTPRSAAAPGLPALTGGPTGPAHASLPAAAQAAVPVRLTIPSLGVSTGLQHLGLLPDHTLQSPSAWQVAGWYADGVRPGDPGPAVIAGHVDSVNGPAVFYRLRDIAAGAQVEVVTANNTTERFVVDQVQSYPKDHFPSEAVYGPTALPVLRLVTCTGDFDYAAHSYLDNLVVTAHLE